KRLGALLDASGLAGPALKKLQSSPLPPAAEAERARLSRVMDLLTEAVPSLALTVDPVEHRGFEYQTGLSFTLFAKGVRGELGRGGRYSAGLDGTKTEPATGFSLYLDSVLRAVPAAARPVTVYLPADTTPAQAAALRKAGWCTLSGLTPEPDIQSEARRLDCTHYFDPAQGDVPCSLD
ncbi:MAG: ATP phosphoribosyltransferase regulatory subunit, partial [Alphaproteobacteria bacterium]|nr:ATP phosphoribosyltransferase regulatory subunit [Alphaproteobacteria bacterium]